MAGFVLKLYGAVMKFLWTMFVHFKRSTLGIGKLYASNYQELQPNFDIIDHVTVEKGVFGKLSPVLRRSFLSLSLLRSRN
jgi:hypothetical protein